nr:hypothetical protein [Tanacetum cinerariifolium]
MGDTIAQTRSENVSKFYNDPLLTGVNTPQSGEDILKLNELMHLCTSLHNMILALEATKTSQAYEIDSLKRRVKKLKKKQRSRTYKLKRLYKVGLSARAESSKKEGLGDEDASKQGRIIDDHDVDEDITLVNDQEMFNANKDLQGEEVVVEQEVVADKQRSVNASHVSVAATNVKIEDITLAKARKDLKTSKPKIRGIIIKDHEEPSESRITTTISSKKSQDKEDIQAKLDANYQLAERMQAKKQQEFNEEEKANCLWNSWIKGDNSLLQKGLKKRGTNHLLKLNKEVLYKAMKRINTFVDFRTELVKESTKKDKVETVQESSSKRACNELAQESSSKRARDELEQESSKKQKIDDDTVIDTLK